MPKKQEPPRPYYEVKHEYVASLKAFEDAATMLFNSVDTILPHWRDGKLPERVFAQLDERLKEFRRAAYGNE